MPRGRSGRIEGDGTGRAGGWSSPLLRAGLAPILLMLAPACGPEPPPHIAAAPPKARTESEPVEVSGSADGFEWQGVGSCAATACHGRDQEKIGPGNAYLTWITHDPHSKAYGVLDGELAARIATQLGPTLEGKTVKPREDPRCLNCHVHPDEGGARHASTFAREDGVGCESCHGPSGQWLELHYSWKRRRPRPPGAAERRKLGMTPTKDLEARATACAGCHVGGPGREVGHDLIAAGHPRLNFELAAYLHDLPKHWDEAAEKEAEPNLEAKAWAIGQVVSARTALEILRARAGVAQSDAGRWPEFAEYDCFACHHDLARAGSRPLPRGDLPLGSLSWGTWYWPMLRTQARSAGGMGLEGPKGILTALRWEMGRPTPDPVAVESLAGRIIDELDGWLAREPWGVTSHDRSVAELMARLSVEGRPPDGSGWDHASQLYLALGALSRTQAVRDKPPDPDVQAALRELARQLRFPDGYHSPHARGPLIPGPFGEALDQFHPATTRSGGEDAPGGRGTPP